jgi:hypothetical protein
MNYVKAILSGLAAIFLAWLVTFWPVFRRMNGHTATGLGVFSVGIPSPVLWILAFLFFVLFVAASRIRNKFLKTFVFWVPTISFSTFVVLILTIYTYAFVHLRHP